MRASWALALVAALGGGAWGDGDAKPLPVKRSIILSRGGTTYYVEGRQTIPWGCEISVQKEMKIVGRGQAVLVVEGSLQVHGVDTREVIIEGVTIEPAPKFEEIRLDMVIFRGGGVKTPAKETAQGKIVVENTTLHGGTTVDVTLAAGAAEFHAATFYDPVRVVAVPPEGKPRTFTKFKAIGAEFRNGLELAGIERAIVRNCALAGGQVLIRDCRRCGFDGNKVQVGFLEFRQEAGGGLKGTKISKCDFYSTRLKLVGPAQKSRDKIPIDKCWFNGTTRRKDIHATVITDGYDDEQCGIIAHIREVKKRPLELGGPWDR